MHSFKKLSVAAVIAVLLAATTGRSEPERLTQLRGSYEAAVERALSPLQQVYVEQLQKLKTELTREGKLDDALAVEAELKALVGPTSNTERAALAQNLTAAPWSSDGGDVITLKKEGTGSWKAGDRVSECTWEIIVQDDKLLAVIYYDGRRENFNAVELSRGGKAMTVTHQASGRTYQFER